MVAENAGQKEPPVIIAASVQPLTRIAATAVAVIAAAGLAVIAWLGVFSRFVADDFCTTAMLQRVGFWESQIHWYKAWSGRFAFTFAMTALELPGQAVARFIPALVILGLTGAIYLSIRRHLGPLHSVAITLAVAWATIGQAPDVFQDVLWATGVVTYTLPLVLIAAWSAFFVVRGRFHPADLLLFIAAAFSETLTAAIGGVAALAIAFFPQHRRRLISPAACIVAAAAIVAIAPGNAVRASYFHHEVSARVVPMVISDLASILLSEVWRGAAACAAVFALAFAAAIEGAPVAKVPGRAIAFVSTAVVWAFAAPSVLTRAVMSAPPPPRALEGSHAGAVVAVLVLGWAAGAAIAEERRPTALRYGTLSALLLSGLLLLDVSGAGRAVPYARSFAQRWDSIDAQLRGARKDVVTAIESPRTVGGLDFLAPSPDHWANRCVADYYGLRGVAGKSP
jgi:hypothetical protein